jgi:hypothetical protein
MCDPIIKCLDFDKLTAPQRKELVDLKERLQKRSQALREYLDDINQSLASLSQIDTSRPIQSD